MKNTWLTLISLLLLTTACDTTDEWLGGDEEDPPLPGKRISILSHRGNLSADESLSSMLIALPPMEKNHYWLPDIVPTEHPYLEKNISVKKSIDAGSSAETEHTVLPDMVIANKAMFVLDASGDVTAYDARNFKEHWHANINHTKTNSEFLGYGTGTSSKIFLGGKLGYGNKVLYVTTQNGEVMALDARTGEEIWRRFLTVPIISSPTVSGNVVLMNSIDNRLFALDTKTGETLWTHASFTEIAGLSGAAAPVNYGDVVIGSFTTGDLYGIEKTTGKVLWEDTLASRSNRRFGQFDFNDIDATPLVSNNVVYVVNYGGTLSAIRIDNGKTLWRQSISGVDTPWLSGEFLFILTTENDIVTVHKDTGKIKWVQELDKVIEESEWLGFSSDTKNVEWSGPVVAGGSLYVVGSHGVLAKLSPFNGKLQQSIKVENGIFNRPQVVEGKMYLIDQDSDIDVLY